MKRMTSLISVLTITILALTSSAAHANIIARALYIETDLGGGSWRYDYTIYNDSDPAACAGCDLFDVDFNFSPMAIASVLSLPNGWSHIQDQGSIEVSSVHRPLGLILHLAHL